MEDCLGFQLLSLATFPNIVTLTLKQIIRFIYVAKKTCSLGALATSRKINNNLDEVRYTHFIQATFAPSQ
jgi:hypothetical protein